MTSILRPSTPPFALTSSTAISTACRYGPVNGAPMPLNELTSPILIGACCAVAGAAVAKTTMVASTPRTRCRLIASPPVVRLNVGPKHGEVKRGAPCRSRARLATAVVDSPHDEARARRRRPGGQPIDRPPVAFWRHAPDVDHTAKGLAEALLSFHRRFDLDLVKVMSSGVYCVEDWGCRVADTGAPSGAKQCVEHAVRAAADWARVRELDPGGGALGRELEAVRLIVRGRHDDAPVLHTVFTPLTIAKKLAGDRLRDDLRAASAAVPSARSPTRWTTPSARPAAAA